MKNQTNETPRVEEGKVIAERLNGYAALFGCWALIGAYITTGQIIPGIVWCLPKITATENIYPEKLTGET